MKWTTLHAVLVGSLLAQEPMPSTPEQRVAAGIAHYRAGRYEPARAEFAAAAAALGAACPAHLAYDLALAALRVQRPVEAEAAARPLLAVPDASTRADAEFVLALAAFQRGERAAAAAQLQDAEPLAWESAIRGVDLAWRGFARAAGLRGTWPEALRNAERAQRRLAELQRLRAEAEAARQKNPREQEPPRPQPPRPAAQPPEEVAPELATGALPPAEVARLLQRVQQRELEKQLVRQTSQRAATVAGERDW